MLPRIYGMGMGIYVTKCVLFAVTSQWTIVFLFGYPVVLQGERKGGIWLKNKEQAGNGEVHTSLCYYFPISVP